MKLTAAQLAAAVSSRAEDRCEYCRMHQSLQGATFHVEHIIPESKGGTTELENLAWCCPTCNLRKSDRIEVVDPHSGSLVSLFHPRLMDWARHFKWEGRQLIGTTDVGRATIAALDLNHSRKILIRGAEERFGLFPT